MTKPTLTLLEPYLKNLGSHYLNYVLDISSAARKMGLKTKVYSDKDIKKEAFEALQKSGIEVVPIFPTNSFSRIKVRAIIWPLLTIFYAIVLIKDRSVFTRKSLSCTISGNLEYLMGASLVLLRKHWNTELFIQMYNWEAREKDSATPRLIRTYRRLTEVVVKRALDSKKLKIFGQGEGVANHISNVLKRPIPVAPFVTNWNTFSNKKKANAVIRIGFMGVMRAEKGFGQFYRAIHYLKGSFRFVIQAQVPFSLAESGSEHMIKKLKLRADCQILEGEIDRKEYNRILHSLDLIVLPYRPENFCHKTSNIFSEAIGLGIIVIAPIGTSMGNVLVKKGIGATYAPYTARALAACIEKVVSRFNELRNISQSAAQEWRQNNSPRAFIRTILEVKSERPYKQY
jgi:glycosyltransferase involved in cell wall biosynthesis